jgi:bacillolysin
LNEALSDIFAALVEKWKGQSDDPSNNHINDAVWKIGEDVWTPATSGDAMRYMYDPEKASSNKDYYPTRYVGTADAGGVHWNSGIANLGEYIADSNSIPYKTRNTELIATLSPYHAVTCQPPI